MSDGDKLSPVQSLRSSFSRKLAVLFLLVVCLIASIGGLIYVQTGSAIQESTEQDMTQATELQANTIGEWVERTREKTHHIADSDRLAESEQSQITEHLNAEQTTAPDSVVAIHYFDLTTHEVLASTDNGAVGVNYQTADVEWAQGDLALDRTEEPIVTHPYQDPTTDANAIAFVSPVADDPDHAIILVVDLKAQTQHLERPSAINSSFTHIVDSRGTVVMSHHHEDIATQNMGPDDEYNVESMGVKRGLAGESGYTEMEISHGHSSLMTMGYAPVPGADWVIMTHVPADAAYALQDDITHSVIALIILSILGLGAVGIVIGRNTTRPLKQLAEKAAALEDGDLDTNLETGRTDEIGQLYDAFESMRVSLRERIQEVEEARDRTDQINRHLEAKADEYQAVMQECAEGDLTQRMEPDSQNEAMTEIAHEFNQMMSELEATTEQLASFATDVAVSSEEVTASTEEVHSASTDISESIQEISDGAERQHERLQAVTQEMNGLSTTIEEIASSSNNVADLAEHTAETGVRGREAAKTAIDGMETIETEAEESVAEIDALQAQIKQIDELVEFITDVAEQTNMLALNANIEASRSGGTDEGFSVVAQEVKELSKDTKQAAEDIEERIEEIKSQTNQTAIEVQRTSDRVAEHTDSVKHAANALDEIAEYATETNEGVQEISAATQQQAAATQEVVAMVDEVTTIAENTTGEAETVAAAGEEQTSALTEVTQAVTDLSQQASELSAELDNFDTDAGNDAERANTVANHGTAGSDTSQVGGETETDSAQNNASRSRGPETAIDNSESDQSTADSGANRSETNRDRVRKQSGSDLAGSEFDQTTQNDESTSGSTPVDDETFSFVEQTDVSTPRSADDEN